MANEEDIIGSSIYQTNSQMNIVKPTRNGGRIRELGRFRDKTLSGYAAKGNFLMYVVVKSEIISLLVLKFPSSATTLTQYFTRK
jgi:hypothetical protein